DLRPAFELDADVGQDLLEPLEVEWLGQVFAGAQLDCFNGAVDGRIGGHQNHFAAWRRRANLAQQVEPVDVGHAEIDHREIGGPAGERPHGFRSAPARDDI